MTILFFIVFSSRAIDSKFSTMLKLLLFLWFTAAVLVLGEGRDRLSPVSNKSLLAVDVTLKNKSEQRVEANTVSNNISIPVTTEKSLKVISDKIKSDESSAGQNSTWIYAVTTAAHPALPSRNATKTVEILTSKLSAATAGAVPLNSANFISHGPGKWVVNVTNQVCIVVRMAVVLSVSYTDINNKTSSRTFEIPPDNTTKASGFCGRLEQNLTLEWLPTKNLTANANMTMHFLKNETEKSYSLHRLDVSLPATSFPNSTLNETIVLIYNASSSSSFPYVVGLTESYRCLKQQTLWLKRNYDNDDNQNLTRNETTSYLAISDLQFQAFKADNSTSFGLAKDCAFDTPDVVPIAVGCALAALVVIVLVAYLIGRRRNQAHGYLSM